MGCGSSSEGGSAKREKATEGEQPPPWNPDDVKWESDASWGEIVTTICKEASDAESQERLRDKSGAAMFSSVREWLNREYPQCSAAGTIEDMGSMPLKDGDHGSAYPSKFLLVLDDNFTGVLYSATMVVAMPLKDEQGTCVVPGASRDAPEMRAARHMMLYMLDGMRESGVDVKHAVANVFMGADMLTCNFDPRYLGSSITHFTVDANDGFKETNKRLARAARQSPDAFRGAFRPLMFKSVIGKRASEHPGCTMWDGGELPFSVKGVAHPYPTRLLIARNFNKMSKDVEATHWKVVTPEADAEEESTIILKSVDPAKDPGGVLSITLVVAFSPARVWPTVGTFLKTATYQAAEDALLQYVKKMNMEGKVQHCAVHLSMGADQTFYKFVGDRIARLPDSVTENAAVATEVVQEGATQEKADEEKGSEQNGSHGKIREEKAPEAKAPQEKEFDDSLEAFSVKLEKQPAHNLFDSESHFRAIKEQTQARARQNPELYQKIAIQAGFQGAKHFLELNFPGCEISDEGEFPATLPDGGEMYICDTRLLVARDPKQKPKSIVAVMNAVPYPGGEDSSPLVSKKSWLGTTHMKAADDMLLALLTKWHKEGKVSEVDCMAQVMMGMDATIYQFVDGGKFIDYDDDRMAKFTWG